MYTEQRLCGTWQKDSNLIWKTGRKDSPESSTQWQMNRGTSRTQNYKKIDFYCFIQKGKKKEPQSHSEFCSPQHGVEECWPTREEHSPLLACLESSKGSKPAFSDGQKQAFLYCCWLTVLPCMDLSHGTLESVPGEKN